MKIGRATNEDLEAAYVVLHARGGMGPGDVAVKIGRATNEDLEAAYVVLRVIGAIGSGEMPCEPGKEDEFEDDYFDENDPGDLSKAFGILKASLNACPPGALLRIIWGMGAMVDSGVFDNSVDYLKIKE